MSTPASCIDLGAVVLVNLVGARERDGVVTEIIRSGRSPLAAVQGAGHPTGCTRYVITGEGFRVVRMRDELGVLVE
jgi:hypothetical protein